MLRAVLDNLDGLDPSLHEHYTEKDGKFFLDIEDDIRAHPKGAALKAALDRTKQEKQTAIDKLTEVEAKLADLPDDFDAEKYATEMDELAKLRKAKKKNDDGTGDDDDGDDKQQVKRLYEQRIANIEAKHVTERDKLAAEKADLEKEIERLVGDEGLTKALVAAGVEKKLLPGATALLRRSVKVKRDDTGWNAIVETDIGESSLDDFVSNWAQSDEGSIYMAKPNGGGAPGSDGQRLGENPFDQKAPNMTRQQAIIASNPERARALASAAGVKPYW